MGLAGDNVLEMKDFPRTNDPKSSGDKAAIAREKSIWDLCLIRGSFHLRSLAVDITSSLLRNQSRRVIGSLC